MVGHNSQDKVKSPISVMNEIAQSINNMALTIANWLTKLSRIKLMINYLQQ